MSSWFYSKIAAVPHRLHGDKGAKLGRRLFHELIQWKRPQSSWFQSGYLAFSVCVMAIEWLTVQVLNLGSKVRTSSQSLTSHFFEALSMRPNSLRCYSIRDDYSVVLRSLWTSHPDSLVWILKVKVITA